MSNYRPKTKPFKHQAKATIAAARHRNYGLFFEPRLGKSKAALDYCGILALKGEIRRVLILAPRIAIQIWEGQLEKHFPYPAFCENYDEEWNVVDKIYAGDPPEVKFFLAGREETFRRMKVGYKYVRPKQRVLEKWNPDVVIVDESHEYKRPGGVGAQDAWRMVRRLRKRSANGKPYVLLLSGTPNPNGWRDLFAPFRIMDDSIFGTDIASFEDRHVVYGHGKRKWTVQKYRNTRSLERKLRAHSTTVNAEEAGLANVQFFESISVKLPDRVKMMYLELVEEFMTEWEGGLISAKNSGVRRIRLLQLCGGFTTAGDQIHSAKVEALRDYTTILYEQGESVVVYSRFTPEVQAATEVLAKVGFRTFRVDGSIKRGARRIATESLETRASEPTAISFQHQAGSRALELVGAAETVYYSPPDGWVDYFQTLKRTQGPNQRRPVRYTHLLARGTVDISVVRNLQNKEDAHAHLFRNPRRYLTGI
jgi:hypothetical protein